jgi:pseudouridylate synthase
MISSGVLEMAIEDFFRISKKFQKQMETGAAGVALESAVITHGLPYPENLRVALEMEAQSARVGALPATIAVLDGKIYVRINLHQLQRLAKGNELHKISVRDFSAAVANGWSGGTTVSATLWAAHIARIRVFATGGIGGIHQQPAYDISADLWQLAKTPLIVVCAGAKAILDLPGTLELLESLGVPVVGYQTDEFPAFYSRSSGLPVSVRADSADEVAKIARAHWDLGLQSAVLVVVPPPVEEALEAGLMEEIIRQALEEAEQQNLRGQAVTPFLLQRVSELSDGGSMRANISLLKNNARVAGEIACKLAEG